MKLLIASVLILIYSNVSMASSGEVELLSRAKYGDYERACFSFFHMTQDDDITLNDYEIQFGNPDNSITVNMVTNDISFIADLGDSISCDNIVKSNRGMSSLVVAGIYIDSLNFKGRVDAKTGHCYLVISNDSNKSLINLFRVKELYDKDRIIIDQIHSLKRIEHYDHH